MLRGGFGIFYSKLGITAGEAANQTGFSQRTNFDASLDTGQTFIANLTNPFPDGKFDRPAGAALGLSTQVGNSVSAFNTHRLTPYTQRWQFSLQRELTNKTVLEVAYVGSKSVKMAMGRQYDTLPAQYLSTSPVRDLTTINYLSAQLPNPFYPLLPRTSLSGVTVARSQLLLPYPEFTGVSVNTNQGYSWYHAMETRVERRFDRGYTINASWTWSKTMDATSYLNSVDPMPARGVSTYDRTHRIALSGIYQFPVGKGKKWGAGASGLLDKVIGGWQFESLFQGQSGAPLGFGNSIFTGDLRNIVLPNDQRTVQQWFNVNAGFNRNSAQQLANNIRTLPLLFSGIRSDGINMWDASSSRTHASRSG